MRRNDRLFGDVACVALALLFAVGLIVLGARLKDVQIDAAASYGYASARQSERRVQTDGIRGRILDCCGRPLADNRMSCAIVCDTSFYQKRTWERTVDAISNAVAAVCVALGRPMPLSERAIRRHVKQELAMPLVVWRNADEVLLARFCERADAFPGFRCDEARERMYPYDGLASHVIGYVGRERPETIAGDRRFDYCQPEMRGRSGLERYYDGYLRGVPGEHLIVVDARGYAVDRRAVSDPQPGPDLHLTLDARVQHAAERELRGVTGACVVMDPRDGGILALASAPGYDPNTFVPFLDRAVYARYAEDPLKPLLNRATTGLYAPGSTFKPVTALAGLASGLSAQEPCECVGVYELGGMRLHCVRRWGHGPLDLPHALMQSCNPFFCQWGVRIGTNALVRAARACGLGARTGIDFGSDSAGVVPTAEWKREAYRQPWYPGDLAQMAIGQGMLLVTPLQMVRLTGAIATGCLVTPHFRSGLEPERVPLPFSPADLETVRRGMRLVVSGDAEGVGSGRRGGEGVGVTVAGKTGTAEVGQGARRRKNVWFVAYAPAERPVVALALVIEDGDSGGATAAPRAAAILRTVFGPERTGREGGGRT